jgi:hypothetical protein
MSAAFWAEWYGQPGDALLYAAGAAIAPYPPVVPVVRRYSFGSFAVSREANLSGGVIKFLHSDYSNALSMTLEYEYLTQLEMLSIRDHYRNQDGSMVPFLLPAEIWAGHSSVDNIVPAGTRWRYQEPPEEEHLSGGLVNVSVALMTADNWLPSPEPATGLDLAVSVLWNPGAATQTGEIDLVVNVVWAAGAATGTAADDDGFAASLFWNEDQYTTWR